MNSRLLLVVGLSFVALLFLALGAGLIASRTPKQEFAVFSVGVE